MTVAFLVTALVVVATPGTGALFTIGAGPARGRGAATWGVFAGYGLFAAATREHVLARPRVVAWLRRVFATAYLVLARRLALAAR